jgi:ATP-binding protein involved in chromosome partitioning
MKIIAVCSGKGGVGKTTISVELAKALSKRGHSVGLLDIDIDTPNVNEFMDINDAFEANEQIEPIVKDGIEVASVGFMLDSDTVVLWDGNKRSMLIEQFMEHVNWSCDTLIVDTPPGTNDEIVTLLTSFTPDNVLLVTTGHRASLADVRRSMKLLSMSKINVIGVVNNMSNIVCSDCGSVMKLYDSISDEMIAPLVIADIPFMNGVYNYDEHEEFMKVVCAVEEVL